MPAIPTLILALLILFAFPQPSGAQCQLSDWITAPTPADSTSLWFRRTFAMPPAESSSRPLSAFVSVATSSRYVLYVNGRNVSTSLFECAPATFDVSRFVRPDSNTVALLVCPTPQRLAAPAVAVGFFGTTASCAPFAFTSADGWLCHISPISFGTIVLPFPTTPVSAAEHYDASTAEPHPAYGDMALARWLPAAPCPRPDTSAGYSAVYPPRISAESLYGYSPLAPNTLADSAVYTRKVIRPRYFDADACSITYDFAPGFCGMVRVTLRDCLPGEHIQVGNLTYTCSGNTDEQAICRFSPLFGRKITVSGDRWFCPGQVQSVEIIGI